VEIGQYASQISKAYKHVLEADEQTRTQTFAEVDKYIATASQFKGNQLSVTTRMTQNLEQLNRIVSPSIFDLCSLS
jgi:hypothetical protein